MDIQPWIDKLAENIADCIESMGQVEYRYYEPENNSYGIHVIDMAPVLMEIDILSEDDGEEVFNSLYHIDLLALQSTLDDVEELSLSFEHAEGEHVINLEGLVDGQDVLVILHLSPFEDAEVSSSIQRTFTDDGQPTIRLVPKDSQDDED